MRTAARTPWPSTSRPSRSWCGILDARYSALRRLDLAGKVYDSFVRLVPEIFDVALADTDLARDLVTSTAGLSARDAVHAAVMLNHEVTTVATFDRGFERLGAISLVPLE